MVFGKEKSSYQKLGGASHIEKSQRSTVQFNVLHAGFAKSSDLQLGMGWDKLLYLMLGKYIILYYNGMFHLKKYNTNVRGKNSYLYLT